MKKPKRKQRSPGMLPGHPPGNRHEVRAIDAYLKQDTNGMSFGAFLEIHDPHMKTNITPFRLRELLECRDYVQCPGCENWLKRFDLTEYAPSLFGKRRICLNCRVIHKWPEP